jgi:hypothetical protein
MVDSGLVRCLGAAPILPAILGLAGRGGSGAPRRVSDMNDQMMSTRTAFLERWPAARSAAAID